MLPLISVFVVLLCTVASISDQKSSCSPEGGPTADGPRQQKVMDEFKSMRIKLHRAQRLLSERWDDFIRKPSSTNRMPSNEITRFEKIANKLREEGEAFLNSEHYLAFVTTAVEWDGGHVELYDTQELHNQRLQAHAKGERFMTPKTQKDVEAADVVLSILIPGEWDEEAIIDEGQQQDRHVAWRQQEAMRDRRQKEVMDEFRGMGIKPLPESSSAMPSDTITRFENITNKLREAETGREVDTFTSESFLTPEGYLANPTTAVQSYGQIYLYDTQSLSSWWGQTLHRERKIPDTPWRTVDEEGVHLSFLIPDEKRGVKRRGVKRKASPDNLRVVDVKRGRHE